MKRDNINYAAVGAFVVLMLALLAGALYVLTGGRGATDEYLVYYGNVGGLEYGTPVYHGGYKIGQVVGVTALLGKKTARVRYRVRLEVKRNWPIRRDSVAAIASAGLLGDVSVQILQGVSPQRLQPGEEIKGQEGTDVFSAFNELAVEVKALTQGSLKPLVEQLNSTLGQGVPAAVEELNRLLVSLNRSAASLEQVLGPQNQQQLAQVLQRTNLAADNAQQLAAELKQTRSQVDALLVQANAILTENRPDLNQSVRELRVSLQAVSERIDSIMEQLDATSRNVQEFSREIRNNPGRLLSGENPKDQVEGKKK
ncbi:MAG: MlaD family protein [Nevskiales bacterium]